MKSLFQGFIQGKGPNSDTISKVYDFQSLCFSSISANTQYLATTVNDGISLKKSCLSKLAKGI